MIYGASTLYEVSRIWLYCLIGPASGLCVVILESPCGSLRTTIVFSWKYGRRRLSVDG